MDANGPKRSVSPRRLFLNTFAFIGVYLRLNFLPAALTRFFLWAQPVPCQIPPVQSTWPRSFSIPRGGVDCYILRARQRDRNGAQAPQGVRKTGLDSRIFDAQCRSKRAAPFSTWRKGKFQRRNFLALEGKVPVVDLTADKKIQCRSFASLENTWKNSVPGIPPRYPKKIIGDQRSPH